MDSIFAVLDFSNLQQIKFASLVLPHRNAFFPRGADAIEILLDENETLSVRVDNEMMSNGIIAGSFRDADVKEAVRITDANDVELTLP
jgi:hypothetical protein